MIRELFGSQVPRRTTVTATGAPWDRDHLHISISICNRALSSASCVPLAPGPWFSQSSGPWRFVPPRTREIRILRPKVQADCLPCSSLPSSLSSFSSLPAPVFSVSLLVCYFSPARSLPSSFLPSSCLFSSSFLGAAVSFVFHFSVRFPHVLSPAIGRGPATEDFPAPVLGRL